VARQFLAARSHFRSKTKPVQLARIAPQHQEIKVFLLLFRKTKEDSSFFEKKKEKTLITSSPFPMSSMDVPVSETAAGCRPRP
jgi:hypothetical protein